MQRRFRTPGFVEQSGSRKLVPLRSIRFLRAAILGGPIGISCDLTKLSPSVMAILKDEIAKFKEEREFWATSECRILCDTETLLVLQFSDAEFGKIKICTYVKIPHQNAVTVYPVCDNAASYVLGGRTFTEGELDEDGFSFYIGERFSASVHTLERKDK